MDKCYDVDAEISCSDQPSQFCNLEQCEVISGVCSDIPTCSERTDLASCYRQSECKVFGSQCYDLDYIIPCNEQPARFCNLQTCEIINGACSNIPSCEERSDLASCYRDERCKVIGASCVDLSVEPTCDMYAGLAREY